MSFHRMGVLMGGYTLVGLGFVSTILISQRYLPSPAVAPLAVSAPATPDLLEIEETPTPKETPKQPVDTAANLDVVLDLLHQEYLNEVNDRALFASSFRLLKEFLATQKVDVKDFPTLPPKIEDRASRARELLIQRLSAMESALSLANTMLTQLRAQMDAMSQSSQ